jgi:molybdopterin molybdotransferase
MHAPADAARLILQHVRPLAPARVSLKAALDLVLAEQVTSPMDVPPWDNSAMDGYAVRAADVGGAVRARPVTLAVIEQVAAGAFAARALGPGEATRVFTGSPVPPGADTVIRQEDTVSDGAGHVTITDTRDAGRNVRRRGEDLRRGDPVCAPGSVLGPAQLGVLASVAHAAPLVHPRPRLSFLAAGDELVPLDRRDDILAGRRIASSNSFTILALARRAGAAALDLGVAADTPASLREHVQRRDDADVLVTAGGVSVGEHDLMRTVLRDLGTDLKLWRVRMRPGAPLAFGLLDGRPWIGLPGNPVSAMVTFELFVRPVIRRLAGHPLPYRRTIRVRLGEPVTLGPPLRHYLRAVLHDDGPGALPTARLTGPQGSGILSSMAAANALVIVPEDRPAVPAGTVLDAVRLDDDGHAAEPGF